MKLVELMESQDLQELGVWQGIKGAAKSIGQGIARAPSQFAAAKSTAAGQEKAKAIEKDLKNRFLMLAGGSGSRKFSDLEAFLDQFNLDKSGLTDPTGSGTDLDDLQLNQLLNQAVRKNFTRIVAAQQGQYIPVPTQSAGTSASQTATPAAAAQQQGQAAQTAQAAQAAQQSGQQSAQTASKPTAATMPTTATAPSAPSQVRSAALAQIRQSIQGLSSQDQRRLLAYLSQQMTPE